jgi:predicted acylesterase/phospholipase RssA
VLEELQPCDLIMKGGITSGIVYPRAICELARDYSFRGIGGTSAGAIAAAATAAAEYGRRGPNSSAYDALAQLPDDLAANGKLLSLFQPEEPFRNAFRLFLALLQAQEKKKEALRSESRLSQQVPRPDAKDQPEIPAQTAAAEQKLGSVVKALLGFLAPRIFAGAGIGLVAAIALALFFPGSYVTYAIFGVTAAVLGAIVSVVFFLIGEASVLLRELPSNGFGVCRGVALTAFLSDLLARLSGKNAPLTFGDLWTAGEKIDLQMMTTNLTHGRPYRLPFQEHVFYFDPEDWSRYFPASVIDVLKRDSQKLPETVCTMDNKHIIALPEAADLPVIVGARMSLSFPVLLSAVPLYAVDFTLSRNIEAKKTGKPLLAEKCWFSDGGISSNFPINFFDNPLPRWPTFGINLKDPHPDHQTEAEMVWLPTNNSAGSHEFWSRFDQGSAWERLFGFFGAIVAAMKDWHDNMQAKTPGYRDRIVHISCRPDEGGLNLTMPPDVIKTLTDRGKRAGEKLRDEFDFDNHMWVRYRSTMATLEDFSGAFDYAYRNPLPRNVPVWNYIRGTTVDAPIPGYPWSSNAQRAFAVQATADLASLAQQWKSSGQTFDPPPRPEPSLRITPEISPLP